MATNPNDAAENRRMMLRRARGAGAGASGGGFSYGRGSDTRAEGMPASSAPPDGVDDAIDPDDYHNRVTARARLPAPPVTPEEARDNPASRLHEVAAEGSASYAKEYRLSLLHRLLMRNTPLDQIARQFNVSISTIEKDRAELRRRLREAAMDLNINQMIGEQNAFYDEAQAMSLRIASGGQEVPTPMKLAAIRTALAANADRTRFNNTAGVFDALRYRRTEQGDDLTDVQLLMQQTGEMLRQFMEGEDGTGGEDDEAPPQRRAVARRKRKAGGFDPMTFDDKNASSGDNEIQEL